MTTTLRDALAAARINRMKNRARYPKDWATISVGAKRAAGGVPLERPVRQPA